MPVLYVTDMDDEVYDYDCDAYQVARNGDLLIYEGGRLVATLSLREYSGGPLVFIDDHDDGTLH